MAVSKPKPITILALVVIVVLISAFWWLPEAIDVGAKLTGSRFASVAIILVALGLGVAEMMFRCVFRAVRSLLGKLNMGRPPRWMSIVAALVLCAFGIWVSLISQDRVFKQGRDAVIEPVSKILEGQGSVKFGRADEAGTDDEFQGELWLQRNVGERHTATFVRRNGGASTIIKPEIRAHQAELCPEFAADPFPLIQDAQLADLLPNSPGPELLLVLRQRSGPVSEVQIWSLEGKLLNDPPLWTVGPIYAARLSGDGRVLILGESITAAWFLPELAGYEENWRSNYEISRYATMVAQGAAADLCGLIGPLPPRGGPAARNLRVWYRLPSPAEPEGVRITVTLGDPTLPPSLAATVETGVNTGVRSQPIPLPVRGKELPVAAGVAPMRTTIELVISSVVFVESDTVSDQEVVAQVLGAMSYLTSPQKLADMIRYSNQARWTKERVQRAISIAQRMASSVAVVNNFGFWLTKTDDPSAEVCEYLRATITGMVDQHRVPTTHMPIAHNTIGALAIATGKFGEAVDPFERALATTDIETRLHSIASLVVCAFHLNDDGRFKKYVGLLRRESAGRVSSTWVQRALALGERRVPLEARDGQGSATAPCPTQVEPIPCEPKVISGLPAVESRAFAMASR